MATGPVGVGGVTGRAVAWATAAVGGAVFVVLAVAFVPWHPYPGGGLVVPAPEDVFGQTFIDTATEYAQLARWVGRASLLVSLVVACVLGFTRARRLVTDRLRGPWPLQVLEAVAAVLLIGRLATLPFGIVLHHHRRSYELSGQGWDAWLLDQALSWVVNVVMVSVVLLVLFGCARRWPRAWPAIAGGLLAALVFAGSFVYPVLVQPLFNDFHSLPDGELRSQVLALADTEGVEVDDVLVSDASRRTTTLNAYVSGFGDTRRIVLYDNLVEDVPEAEALSVVAHELAHAKYDDVLLGTALGAAGAVFAVGLLGLLAGRRYDGLRRPAAVPLILALFAVGSAAATPVENLISRQIETRADVVGLRATGDVHAFVALQKDLAMRALADPSPPGWSQWWFGSHPTALERIALAHRILD